MVYLTGDARQLYPHELVRPLPPDKTPPPVYSLAPPPEEVPPPYSCNRKPSVTSTSLPTAVFTPPQRSYQLRSYLEAGRRKSEGVLRMFGRREAEDDWKSLEMGIRSEIKMAGGIELKLPPPRRTKDPTRQSFNLEPPSVGDDVGTITGLSPPPLAVTATRRGAVDMSAGWEEQLESQRYRLQFSQSDLPDSPGEFTEENDFGIVVSEAFEEDAPYQYTPVLRHPTPLPQADEAPASSQQTMDPPLPQTSTRGALAPLAPLVQGPECAARWRRTLPDILSPNARQEETNSERVPRSRKSNPTLVWAMKESNSRRGSRSSDPPTRMWPWPRTFLGPMTLVYSPLVRRAHWVVTVRCAGVALVVTCGMALGLVR